MHVSSTYRPQNQSFPQGNLAATTSYTFSAKEKDSETSLSYFGSRYYSSDLSVWLSVDPMSDKYPSLSPYVYCADNPVKLVDPNGEEWVDPEDKNLADKLIQLAVEKIINNERKIYRLEKRVAKLLTKGETPKVIALKTQIDDYKLYNSILSEGIEGIKSMELSSEYKFHFNISDNKISNVTKNKSNTININVFSGYIEETAWHECVHVSDWMTNLYCHGFKGDVLGTFNNNQGKAEKHAYLSEYIFSNKRFWDKFIKSYKEIDENTHKLFE